MIVYIYNIGVDLYNGFNGLRHRINWTYFTVLDGLAHPLYSEKDNEYDKEAISVNLPGLGKIGYVANSPYTVLGESYSAGRLYDKISEEASGKVKFKLDKGVICELIE